jgi:hypothetical protein
VTLHAVLADRRQGIYQRKNTEDLIVKYHGMRQFLAPYNLNRFTRTQD